MCRNVCNKYRKFRKTKILYIFFKKTLSLSIFYIKCNHEYENSFKEEESIRILKILGLINKIDEYQKIYDHAWIKYNPRMKTDKINEIRNYLIEEINWNKLMSIKYKNSCRVLNYIDHSFIIVSTITECVSISAFASLVGIPIGIAISLIGLKICVITAGIKKYKSKIKKKKKKHDKIVLLAKSKLNSIKVLISKALIDWNISHDEFGLINNVLKNFIVWNKKLKILIMNKSLNNIQNNVISLFKV